MESVACGRFGESLFDQCLNLLPLAIFSPRDGADACNGIFRPLIGHATVELHDMTSRHWRLFMAVCAWQVCVIGSFLAFPVLTGGPAHIWSKGDLAWIAELAVCGLFVVGAVAKLSRRFGKIGGAVAGLLCGLLPSVLLLTWVFVARPGFEASAGGAGMAYMLAVPSGIGGVLAGIICSEKKKTS